MIEYAFFLGLGICQIFATYYIGKKAIKNAVFDTYSDIIEDLTLPETQLELQTVIKGIAKAGMSEVKLGNVVKKVKIEDAIGQVLLMGASKYFGFGQEPQATPQTKTPQSLKL